MTIEFCASGRGRAQCAANPDYPAGVDVDASEPGRAACLVSLPYPAPECGTFRVVCAGCGLRVVLTAAGRADDPRSLRVACLPS